MKISNLSPQINFAKVIEIEKDRRDEIHMWNGFEAEQTIADVLNGKKSRRVAQKYTEKDEQKIKEFFKPLLGEDNKNVLFRCYDRRKYLITGQESEDVLNLEKFVEDVRKINYPKTNYALNAGTYDDGSVGCRIRSFISTMRDASYEKCRALARYHVYNDPSQVKLKLDYGDSCDKIQFFEANTKNDVGETKTITLNLNV